MASCRPAAARPGPTILMALLLLVPFATPARAGTEATDGPLRRWGFGWDPADAGVGLTVRHRFSPVWDLSVAAGPNDYRSDHVSETWDDDEDAYDDGVPRIDGDRQEQGWVRLAAGRRFWQEGRVNVSGVAAVTYRWSVEETRYRYLDRPEFTYTDYYNRRLKRDRDIWTLALGIRPAVVVTPRLQVEFEAGLAFGRQHTAEETVTWWDSYPESTTRTDDTEMRTFGSYGGFDFYKLKFIFWF